jgi:2,5-diketo-D-gluconate reductase A
MSDDHIVPTVDLTTPTGSVPIPQLGFGVWQVSEEEVVPSVATALQTGYRHIDTAAMYGNERGVGQAISDSGLGDNVWLTTKLNNDAHGFDAAMKAFDASMDKLQRETLDLYLIHWPLPAKDQYAEAWKAMQALRDDGRITTIGVCNFQVPHLQKLYDQTGEFPAINQIELHPYLVQQELRDFQAEHGIVTEAWSPLASGGLGVMEDETITSIAQAHSVTPAQAILRWHLQLGNVVIPKSVTPSRIEENFDLFGFELTDEEVERITGLDRGERTGPDPDTFNP